MILIHTALLCEAQSFIEVLKLKKVNSSPKIYLNDSYILVISGIGKENTSIALKYILEKYDIEKAFNIGVAGCNDKDIEIGSLFCTNGNLDNINYLQLKTVDMPQTISDIIEPTLYDMEGNYFLEYLSSKLKNKDLFILKVVSDYLDDTILVKDDIKALIKKQMPIILKIMK